MVTNDVGPSLHSPVSLSRRRAVYATRSRTDEVSPATFLNLGSVATYLARCTCASWIISVLPVLAGGARWASARSSPAPGTGIGCPTTFTRLGSNGHRAPAGSGSPCENSAPVDKPGRDLAFCAKMLRRRPGKPASRAQARGSQGRLGADRQPDRLRSGR